MARLDSRLNRLRSYPNERRRILLVRDSNSNFNSLGFGTGGGIVAHILAYVSDDVSGSFLTNTITERVDECIDLYRHADSARGKRRIEVAVSWTPRMSSCRKQICPPECIPAMGASTGSASASIMSG